MKRAGAFFLGFFLIFTLTLTNVAGLNRTAFLSYAAGGEDGENNGQGGEGKNGGEQDENTSPAETPSNDTPAGGNNGAGGEDGNTGDTGTSGNETVTTKPTTVTPASGIGTMSLLGAPEEGGDEESAITITTGVYPTNAGTVSPSEAITVGDDFTSQTLTATAFSGYTFKEWRQTNEIGAGDDVEKYGNVVTDATATYTISVKPTASVIYTAIFETASSADFTLTPSKTEVSYGDVLSFTLTGIDASDVTFSSNPTGILEVKEDGSATIKTVGDTSPVSVTVTATSKTGTSKTATATVKVKKKDIVLQIKDKSINIGENIPTTFDYDKSSLVSGDEISTVVWKVVDKKDNDKTITGKTTEAGTYNIRIDTYTDARYNITNQKPGTLTVNGKYTVKVTNGTAEAEGVAAAKEISVFPDTTVTIKATKASDGYKFGGWDAVGVTITKENDEETTFKMPKGDVTLTARHVPDTNVSGVETQTKTKAIDGDTVAKLKDVKLERIDKAPEDVDDIETEMLMALGTTKAKAGKNWASYDVTLQIRVNKGDWKTATKDNFPKEGLAVTIPYPTGTDKTYKFKVAHMFTENMNGFKKGDIEIPTAKNTDSGIQVTLRGLSPVMITWEATADSDSSSSSTNSGNTVSGRTSTTTTSGSSGSSGQSVRGGQTGDEMGNGMLEARVLTLSSAMILLAALTGKRKTR